MPEDPRNKIENTSDEEVTEVSPLAESGGETEAPEQPPEKPSDAKPSQKGEGAGSLEEQIKALEAERDEFKDKFLRTYADFENYRKRVSRDKEDLVKFSNEKLLKEILFLKDDLKRAVAHQDTSDLQTLKEGLALIGRDLDKLLAQFEIQEIKAVGEAFDPQIHEAMAEEESDQAPGTILSEYQTGYLFHGRLLRPAQVIVAKQGSAGEKHPKVKGALTHKKGSK